MTADAAAELLARTLYYKRFFPYYVSNMLAGISRDGMVFQIFWISKSSTPYFGFQAKANSTSMTRSVRLKIVRTLAKALVGRMLIRFWTIKLRESIKWAKCPSWRLNGRKPWLRFVFFVCWNLELLFLSYFDFGPPENLPFVFLCSTHFQSLEYKLLSVYYMSEKFFWFFIDKFCRSRTRFAVSLNVKLRLVTKLKWLRWSMESHYNKSSWLCELIDLF